MKWGLLVVALLLAPAVGPSQGQTWDEQMKEADRLRTREATHQAEALYRAALADAEKSGDSVRMARALDGMAGTFQDQGRYRDGLATSYRSLQVLAGLREPAHPATLAPAYYNIGGCLWHLGSYRESEKAF